MKIASSKSEIFDKTAMGLSAEFSLPNLTDYILTRLTYGCLVCPWHALKTKTLITKLHRLKKLALLSMSPVKSHTLTAGLEVFSNIKPLNINIYPSFSLRRHVERSTITRHITLGGQ